MDYHPHTLNFFPLPQPHTSAEVDDLAFSFGVAVVDADGRLAATVVVQVSALVVDDDGDFDRLSSTDGPLLPLPPRLLSLAPLVLDDDVEIAVSANDAAIAASISGSPVKIGGGDAAVVVRDDDGL
jgi:hypothetical protein